MKHLLKAIFTFCALLPFGNTFAQTQIIWTDSFTLNVAANSTQHADWNAFRALLVPHTYTKVTISGTFDQAGQSCTDPVVVAALANSLNTNTDYISPLVCGHVWHNCASHGYDGEVWLDPPSACDGGNCPSPGYIIRPNLSFYYSNNANWGGVNSATCGGATQRQTMIFEYSDVTTDVSKPAVTEPSFYVYPNPFNNSFSVSFKDINTAELTISNLVGQVVYKQQVNSGTTTIDTEKLNSGIYFVSVKTENGILTKKLVKE